DEEARGEHRRVLGALDDRLADRDVLELEARHVRRTGVDAPRVVDPRELRATPHGEDEAPAEPRGRSYHRARALARLLLVGVVPVTLAGGRVVAAPEPQARAAVARLVVLELVLLGLEPRVAALEPDARLDVGLGAGDALAVGD